MNRDDLRAQLLANAGSPVEEINFKGTCVDFVRPPLKRRAEIARQCSEDSFGFIFEVIKECCCVPGTSETIFEDADREAFDNCRPGSFFDHMVNKVKDLIAPDTEEDIGKK